MVFLKIVKFGQAIILLKVSFHMQRAKDTQEYIFFHLLSGSVPVRAQKLVLLLCFSLSLATGDAAEKC